MSRNIRKTDNEHASPFEQIKRVNDAGYEFWSSREFAEVLGYGDYRNFEAVVEKAKIACFNSAHPIEDHFVDVTEMIEIGKGGQRAVKTMFMSRYACYLAIQNADPKKEQKTSYRNAYIAMGFAAGSRQECRSAGQFGLS